MYAGRIDDTIFSLHDLSEMKIEPKIAERGHQYYVENKVCYISIDNDHGRAIVLGSEPYELEFRFKSNGQISELTCTCPCAVTCKHEFATMLQLQETLDIIMKHAPYADECERTNYFAAISRNTLLQFANNNQKTGKVVLG